MLAGHAPSRASGPHYYFPWFNTPLPTNAPSTTVPVARYTKWREKEGGLPHYVAGAVHHYIWCVGQSIDGRHSRSNCTASDGTGRTRDGVQQVTGTERYLMVQTLLPSISQAESGQVTSGRSCTTTSLVTWELSPSVRCGQVAAWRLPSTSPAAPHATTVKQKETFTSVRS